MPGWKVPGETQLGKPAAGGAGKARAARQSLAAVPMPTPSPTRRAAARLARGAAASGRSHRRARRRTCGWARLSTAPRNTVDDTCLQASRLCHATQGPGFLLRQASAPTGSCQWARSRRPRRRRNHRPPSRQAAPTFNNVPLARRGLRVPCHLGSRLASGSCHGLIVTESDSDSVDSWSGESSARGNSGSRYSRRESSSQQLSSSW